MGRRRNCREPQVRRTARNHGSGENARGSGDRGVRCTHASRKRPMGHLFAPQECPTIALHVFSSRCAPACRQRRNATANAPSAARPTVERISPMRVSRKKNLGGTSGLLNPNMNCAPHHLCDESKTLRRCKRFRQRKTQRPPWFAVLVCCVAHTLTRTRTVT